MTGNLPQPHGLSPVFRARQAVRDARGVLVMQTPDAVASAVPRLEEAVASITELANSLRSGEDVPPEEALTTLDDIRSELSRISAVLNYAAAYHAAWARILCSMASGYTAAGAAPMPEPPPRITVTG